MAAGKRAEKSKAPEAKAPSTKPTATTAKKSAPKQLGNVCGPFVFQNQRTLKLRDLLKLDPAHQQQFVLQSQSYMGTSAKSAQACVGEIAEYDGISIDKFSIDLWDIAQVGQTKPIFEYWVSAAGDGEVFWAGEARPTSVQSVQREFQSLDYDEASHALAAALQALVPTLLAE